MSIADNSMLPVALAAALLVAACGGKEDPAGDTTPDPEPTPTGPAKPASLPPDGSPIDAFHDLLAPLWHAVGTTRMQQVCNAQPELAARVAAVRKAGAPDDLDESAWSASLTKVESTLGGMKGPCGGTDSTKFETAFTALHWAFHDYMDLVVGDHGHGVGDGRGGKQGIPK